MSTERTIGFREILEAASREVNSWPDWKRSDEALAWKRQTEERRRQFEQEKAKAASLQKDEIK